MKHWGMYLRDLGAGARVFNELTFAHGCSGEKIHGLPGPPFDTHYNSEMELE
jgi:hypothetical protein